MCAEARGSRATADAGQGYHLLTRYLNDKAQAMFDKALKLNPNHRGAHEGAGASHFAEGRLEEAIVHFKRVVELDPNGETGAMNLANALGKAEKNVEAAKAYRRVLEINPGKVRAKSKTCSS